jgi:hypothetical protein
VEENIFERSSVPNLHIKTFYDNICVSEVENLKRWILKEGAEFHAKMRDYISRFDLDSNPQLFEKKGGARISVGTFSMSETPKQDKES